jgi:hypothetical protein
MLKYEQDIKNQVKDISRDTTQIFGSKIHTTIFHEILNAKLPERHPDRLWQEGFLLIGAGTETTSWSKYYPLGSANVVSSIIDAHQSSRPRCFTC